MVISKLYTVLRLYTHSFIHADDNTVYMTTECFTSFTVAGQVTGEIQLCISSSNFT